MFGRILQEHLDRGYGSELVDAAKERVDYLRHSGVVAGRDENKQMDKMEQAAQLIGVAASQTAGKAKRGGRQTSKKQMQLPKAGAVSVKRAKWEQALCNALMHCGVATLQR
ncbi:hypothetical protein LTR17_020034 [Elasticomyces elasticus]|nr:hypothetical protein LTR17_020034 [Elasticomyces elasticus]